MPDDFTTNSYLAKPDEAHWNLPEADKSEVEIVSTPAPADNFPTGRFKKGHDPRRHKFTPEECTRGFWAAIDSIVTRYPNAIMADGRHIACNFLRSRS
jgi:hypothetical protein